jgi:hypothetical protein
MRLSIRVVIILLMCFVFNACSQTAMQTDAGAGSDPMLESGVGTVVNNPGDNQLQIAVGDLVPEKDELMLAETAFNLAELLKIKQHSDNEEYKTTSLHMILASESLKAFMREDSLFRTFGRLVKKGLDVQGISFVTETPVMVTIPKGSSKEHAFIVNMLNEAEVVIDSFDSTYVRFYLKDVKNDKYHGTYLVKMQEGRPVKGLFAYVTPKFMTDGAEALGKGFTAMAFDVSGTTVKFMVHKEDYVSRLGRQVATLDYLECDSFTEACVTEHFDITSLPPERYFGAGLMRYSWSNTHPNLCVAPMTYVDGERVLIQPKTLNVDILPPVLENCELLMTPFWDDYMFTTDDLVFRSADETPTSLKYYLDGTSVDGWSQLKPTTINEWLSL